MITNIIDFKLIQENLQLADKVYFKTNKLTSNDKEVILSITNGDNYTKAISDIYYQMNNEYTHNQNVLPEQYHDKLKIIYYSLKQYNKNRFPIKDFNILNLENNTANILRALEIREKILNDIKKLPSIAIRNLQHEFIIERDARQLNDYERLLGYFIGLFSLISNRDDKLKKIIYNKMFKSGITLDQLIDFCEEKSNLLGGKEFTKSYVKKLCKESDDLYSVYEKDNIMVVQVIDAPGIKQLGCNSLWCFTYGQNNYRDWNNYSYNGIVYVIIDFNKPSDSEYFMYVLIKPLDEYDDDYSDYVSVLYNMQNEPIINPSDVVYSLIDEDEANKLFTFET